MNYIDAKQTELEKNIVIPYSSEDFDEFWGKALGEEREKSLKSQRL